MAQMYDWTIDLWLWQSISHTQAGFPDFPGTLHTDEAVQFSKDIFCQGDCIGSST